MRHPRDRPCPLRQMFCTLSFTSIRAMSCSASVMCRRFPVLNNVLVTNLVLPVWFSFGLMWVKTEPFGRQRQIALFSMAGAAAAMLKLINLWPSDEITKSVVTAYLFPLVLGASTKAIASGTIRPPAPA